MVIINDWKIEYLQIICVRFGVSLNWYFIMFLLNVILFIYVRFGGQLINKEDKFKYLKSIVRKNGGIVEDAASKI